MNKTKINAKDKPKKLLFFILFLFITSPTVFAFPTWMSVGNCDGSRNLKSQPSSLIIGENYTVTYYIGLHNSQEKRNSLEFGFNKSQIETIEVGSMQQEQERLNGTIIIRMKNDSSNLGIKNEITVYLKSGNSTYEMPNFYYRIRLQKDTDELALEQEVARLTYSSDMLLKMLKTIYPNKELTRCTWLRRLIKKC